MIAITMLTVKEGRLIKIKVATEYENEVLMHYGKDWHKVRKVERKNGISYIEILQFSKFMIKRIEELINIT